MHMQASACLVLFGDLSFLDRILCPVAFILFIIFSLKIVNRDQIRVYLLVMSDFSVRGCMLYEFLGYDYIPFGPQE